MPSSNTSIATTATAISITGIISKVKGNKYFVPMILQLHGELIGYHKYTASQQKELHFGRFILILQQ